MLTPGGGGWGRPPGRVRDWDRTSCPPPPQPRTDVAPTGWVVQSIRLGSTPLTVRSRQPHGGVLSGIRRTVAGQHPDRSRPLPLEPVGVVGPGSAGVCCRRTGAHLKAIVGG